MASRSDENPSITVRRAAMNMLARREQSFFEMFQKLTQKYPDLDRDEVILPALEKLRDENLQSDQRFVESYVRYRASRGFGPLKIGMELGQKGVSSQLVNGSLHGENIDWEAMCRQAMVRKFSAEPAQSMTEKEKRYRFLGQRGFDNEQIRRVLAPK